MSTPLAPNATAARTAAWQVPTLVLLALAFFLPIVRLIFEAAMRNPEAAHAPAVVVMIAVLLWRRRAIMAAEATRGSLWGLALIGVALLVFAASTFPFNFQLSKRMAIAPALVGAVLAAGGWRVMWRALPLVLLLLIAVPIGPRFWAFLVIRPETITLSIVQMLLELLPGVGVELDGLDLVYTRAGTEGTIGLGQSYRGASLILSYVSIGVFMTFFRVRAAWQVLAMMIAALPIALFCNLSRLVIQGVFTIFTTPDPLSDTPRAIATVLSLTLAMVLFGITLVVLAKLVTDAEPGTRTGDDDDDSDASDARPRPASPRPAPADPAARRPSLAFLSSAAFLLVATVGLRPGIAAVMDYYSKKPIALRLSFDQFDPSAVKSFEFVEARSGSDPLARNEDIGTDDWIAHRFRPPRAATDTMILHATYYSDSRESIPHTPEVCYRLAGATVNSMRVIEFETPALAPDLERITAKLLEITEENGDVVVLYTMCINDAFYAKRERARVALGWPGDEFIFLSKIEVVAPRAPGVSLDDTVEQCKTLLVEAIAELRARHLPTRDDVARKK